jgi:hypothetical protein
MKRLFELAEKLRLPIDVRRGTTSQLAEKLVRAVGRGFIPGIKPIKSTRASALRYAFAEFRPKPGLFRSLLSRRPFTNNYK